MDEHFVIYFAFLVFHLFIFSVRFRQGMTNTEVSEFTKPSAEDTQTITNWLDSEDGECVKFVVLLFWFLVLVF